MFLHGFDACLAEDRVVAVPPEVLVREEIEILVDAEAAASEDFPDA